MRVVVNDPDPAWLEQRRRWGADFADEVWDGVLHVPPQPTSEHQGFESELEFVLRPIGHALGLRVFHQIAVFDPPAGDKNYRAPDITVVDPKFVSKRGVEARAELVVEILSPNDESRNKFDFYAKCGIPEVWLVDPATREIEVYVLRGATYFAATANREGTIHAPRLGLELRTIEGPTLRITSTDGSVEI